MMHLSSLVGALTSKPYAFTARSWELKNVESIDVFDAIGSNIKISTRGSSVLRILPKINDRVNEEWISDKVRFSYDALKFQRILYCFKKDQKNGSFYKINWPKFFSLFIKPSFSTEFFPLSKKLTNSINFYCGSFTDLNTLSILDNFKKKFKITSLNVINSNFSLKNHDFRSDYVFSNTFESLDKKDVCFLIGCNPRLEAPALNLRLRKNVLNKSLVVYTLGFNCNLTYKSFNLGNSFNSIVLLLEGKSFLNKRFNNFKSPLFLSGVSFLQTFNSENLFKFFKSFFNNKSFSFDILPSESSSVNFFENGSFTKKINKYLPISTSNVEWLLNEDKSYIMSDKQNSFKVYQGHHGDFNSSSSDVILPSNVFAEKNSTFINFQGFFQKTKFADSSVLTKNVRDDFITLQTLLGVSKGSNLILFENQNSLKSFSLIKNINLYHNKFFLLPNNSVYYYMQDFYRNDSITRNSPIMALTSNRVNFKKSSFKK